MMTSPDWNQGLIELNARARFDREINTLLEVGIDHDAALDLLRKIATDGNGWDISTKV